MMMPALVMLRHRLAGQAGEVRQLRQRDVHAERARAVAIARDAARGTRPADRRDATSLRNRSVGLRLETTIRGRDASGRSASHPRRRAVLDQHLR